MKLHLTTIATIAALASGIGVASAAGNHAMSNASTHRWQRTAFR